MNFIDFLQQIKDISLGDGEKENQTLFHHQNITKGEKSAAAAKKPFAEQTIKRKSKKKLTFLLEEDQKIQASAETADTCTLKPEEHRSRGSERSTDVSSHPALTSKWSVQSKVSKQAIAFPQDHQQRMKVLMSLR